MATNDNVDVRTDNILYCKICDRHMSSANCYNRHLKGKKHKKIAKRNGIFVSLPLVEGDDDYYEQWPPVAIDCSSPIFERLKRTCANPFLNLLPTRDRFSECSSCKKPIGFGELCWEIKPCNHWYDLKCFSNLLGEMKYIDNAEYMSRKCRVCNN